jgi:hypothetical protein
MLPFEVGIVDMIRFLVILPVVDDVVVVPVVPEVKARRIVVVHHEVFILFQDAVGVLIVVGDAVVVLIEAGKDTGIGLGIVRSPILPGGIPLIVEEIAGG